MFIYLVSSRIISWDNVQSFSLHMGLFCGNDQLAVHYHILILYNAGLIKSENHSLTLHSRVMASGGNTTRDLAGDSGSYQLFTPLHMRSRTVRERGKEWTDSSASVNAPAISWYNVKLQAPYWQLEACINVQCWVLTSCGLWTEEDDRWQYEVREMCHSLIFHWWKMKQHCILPLKMLLCLIIWVNISLHVTG